MLGMQRLCQRSQMDRNMCCPGPRARHIMQLIPPGELRDVVVKIVHRAQCPHDSDHDRPQEQSKVVY